MYNYSMFLRSPSASSTVHKITAIYLAYHVLTSVFKSQGESSEDNIQRKGRSWIVVHLKEGRSGIESSFKFLYSVIRLSALWLNS